MKSSKKTSTATSSESIICPFSLRMEVLDRMLNFEILDDLVYDGMEVQGYHDIEHGTGHVVFLNRKVTDKDATKKTTTKTDVYFQEGLKLNPQLYKIGGGLGVWKEWTFETIRLEISEQAGVDAEVDFHDVDGRRILVHIREPTAHPSQMAHGFLAPMGAAITDPQAMPLVYMTDFDLLRRGTGPNPLITIDGRPASPGQLPFERFLGRRLIKVAKNLCIVSVNPSTDSCLPSQKEDEFVPLPEHSCNSIELNSNGDIVAMSASFQDHKALLHFERPFPSLVGITKDVLNNGEKREGRWSIDINSDTNLIGGIWKRKLEGRIDHSNAHDGLTDALALSWNVTQGWRPHGLPLLMKVVTTFVSIFRQWPTTYQWNATILCRHGSPSSDLQAKPEQCPTEVNGGDNDEQVPCRNYSMRSRWNRTGQERGESYRRVFGRRNKKDGL